MRSSSLLATALLTGCDLLLGLGEFDGVPAPAGAGGESGGPSAVGGEGGGDERGGGGAGQGLGEACVQPSDCQSGFCSDAVCCDAACGDACRSCALVPGTCMDVAVAMSDGDCAVCDGNGACATGAVDWVRYDGGANGQQALALAGDGAGDLYAVGQFDIEMTLGTRTINAAADSRDAFVAKLDGQTGTPAWIVPLGGIGADYGFGVASSQGTVAVCGSCEADTAFLAGMCDEVGSTSAFVVELDATNGRLLWPYVAKTSAADGAYDATYDQDGVLYVVGETADTDDSDGDAWIQTFGPLDHTPGWGFHAGDEVGPQVFRRVAIDEDGNVLLVGQFYSSITVGGASFNSQGAGDALVAKLDATNGNLIWAKAFGSTGVDYAVDVAPVPGGRVAITGYVSGPITFGGAMFFSGSTDAFVAVLGSNDGSHVWSGVYGFDLDETGHAIGADASGNVLMGGDFASKINLGFGDLSPAGASDGFVAKFAPGGQLLWQRAIGGTADDAVREIVVQQDGRVAVAGYGTGDIYVGGDGPHGPGTATDPFVATLMP